MARPQKQGLEYFPFDVSFFGDIRIRKLIKYHGIQAVPVYEILLCRIYENGYFLEWDEDIPFIISEVSGLKEDTIAAIINYCIEIGLFNKTVYEESRVLTSRSIQQRYLNAFGLTRRKMRTDRPYSLLDFSEYGVSSANYVIPSEETPGSSEEMSLSNEKENVTSEETPEKHEKSAQKKEKKNEDIDSSLRSESPSSVTTGKDDEVNFLAFKDFFNRTMQEHGALIPTITRIGGQRRQRLLARVKEYGKEALLKVVINAATSPFLNGASDKSFVASLDWIIRPNNFPKVLEGNYNHGVTNPYLKNHESGNNNGYRTSDDIRQGAARIISDLSKAAQQPKTDLPVV